MSRAVVLRGARPNALAAFLIVLFTIATQGPAILANDGRAAAPSVSPASQLTLVVNKATDGSDSGGCQQPTQTFPLRNCTLREAIAAANAHANASGEIDLITFKASLTQINILNPLPPITGPTEICGDCGAASRHLILDGASASTAFDGLTVEGDHSTVRGMEIRNFGRDGVRIQASFVGLNNDIVDSNFKNGVHIAGGAHNKIGGNVQGAGNVISGNGRSGGDSNARNGILVDGGAGNNTIVNNRIGTDGAGNHPNGNGGDGIRIVDVSNNTIGGATHANQACNAHCNLISGNQRDGVSVACSAKCATTTGNIVRGDFIGVSLGGLVHLATSFRVSGSRPTA